MNDEAMKEVLNELFSHLERLETQNEAILQFLKEKKRVTDKQLAPYLEQAANASNVKWRAARVRIDHLLEPEHPEKEIKLGKKPELHEDSSSAASSSSEEPSTSSSEEKWSVPADKEDKRGEPIPVKAAQARPADGKADKTEAKSALNQANNEQPEQDRREKKSESVHHPAEVTAVKESAEPSPELNSTEEKSDQEAA